MRISVMPNNIRRIRRNSAKTFRPRCVCVVLSAQSHPRMDGWIDKIIVPRLCIDSTRRPDRTSAGVYERSSCFTIRRTFETEAITEEVYTYRKYQH